MIIEGEVKSLLFVIGVDFFERNMVIKQKKSKFVVLIRPGSYRAIISCVVQYNKMSVQ